MKAIAKRSIALLMAFFICLSMLPAHHIAAAANVDYVVDSTTGYIYNWGNRGETATYLSQNAVAFYANEKTDYDILSAYAGGTGTTDAPNSELFTALYKLMAKNHVIGTSYDTEYGNARYWFPYTDCQNSGKETKAISSFYSGVAIGPAWDKGETWNREHTWPNSKATSGEYIREADIMMLRPTASTENGARGNKAYGESIGFYHPNEESNGLYDVRGDVARIVLYVYVRWGGDTENAAGALNYMWGSDGVIESLDVLLTWMEEDPVDTWELGRNDSVQSIVGTRNVFVDYPELAFLLFGAEIPDDMVTPSGEATGNGGCDHSFVAGETVAATCTSEGYTVYTCSLCTLSYNGDKVPMIDHNFVDGTCSACGEAEPLDLVVINKPVVGTAYKFGMIQKNVSTTDVYYLNGVMSTYYFDTSRAQKFAIDVYLEEATGGYYLYTIKDSAKIYINMVVNDTHVNAVYQETASTVYTFDMISKTLIADINGTPYWFGTRNDADYTTVGAYKTEYNGFYCQFYGVNPYPDCQHATTTVVGKKDATCTEDGHSGYTICSVCGVTVDEGSVIPALKHDYKDGVCTRCGDTETTATVITATLDFSTKDNLTYYSTVQQVWEQNGITLTNDKAAYNSDIKDYYNPARFYTNTKLTIACPGMTKIAFTCNSSSYATALVNSIGTVDGATVTADGAVVTVEFAEPQDTFVIEKLTAQVRMNSLTVTAVPPEPVTAEAALDFSTKDNLTYYSTVQQVWEQNGITLTNDKAAYNSDIKDYYNPARFYTNTKLTIACSGMTKIAFTCNSSSYATALVNSIGTVDGATVTADGSVVTIEFAAAQDTFVIEKLTAQVRMNSLTVTYISTGDSCKHTNTTVEGKKDATCTEDGYTGDTVCSVCGATVDEGAVIPAGHSFADGKCSVCGVEKLVVINYPIVGTAYKFGMIQEKVSTTDVYYLTGDMDGYYFGTTKNQTTAIDVYLEDAIGGYYLYILKDNAKLYINIIITSNGYINGVYEKTASTVYTYDMESKTMIADINGAPYWFGTRNDMTYTTVGPCATSYNGFYCQFYGSASENACEHANVTTEGAKGATCTEDGHTGKVTCNNCGKTLRLGAVIPAGHDYADGVCTRCSKNEPITTEATLSFASKSNLTYYSTVQQVWEQNGIILTNDKAAYNNDLKDYYNPARFYANTKLTIACPYMIKITFICNSSSYATDLVNSIGTVAGATVTADGSVVTVEFGTAQDTFVIEKLAKQVRMNSLTVYLCGHANTTIEGALIPACTTDGHTGKTVCTDCGGMISEGEVIPALDHSYEGDTCTRCGAMRPVFATYLVSYEMNGHGEAINSQRIAAGNAVARPADPTEEGYIFEGWYQDSACTIPYDFTAVVTTDIVLYAKWTKAEDKSETDVDSAEVFEDLSEDNWYFTAVDFMVDHGLMNGVSESEFAPNENLSRAMMWTILARLSGEDTNGGENWYEKGQDWAVETGISDGADPKAEITREQVVVMLWRFMGQPAASGDMSGYTDADSVSTWAKEAMAWAIENGVISGVTSTSLDPKGTATRAQIATFVMRFHSLMEAQNS